MSKKRKQVSSAEFVKLWQTAASASAVAQDLGLSRGAVSARATYLRKGGVPLKKFESGRRRMDLDALKALALMHAPKDTVRR